MKYNIEFCGEYHLVITSGVADIERWSELLDALFGHEKWRPGGSFVADHSGLIVNHITSDDVKKMASLTSKRRSEAGVVRHAIVAPQDLTFGFGRMWQAYVGDETDALSAVFRSRKEAIDWVSA